MKLILRGADYDAGAQSFLSFETMGEASSNLKKERPQ